MKRIRTRTNKNENKGGSGTVYSREERKRRVVCGISLSLMVREGRGGREMEILTREFSRIPSISAINQSI